jgi:FAD:protein FMN transferase
MRSRSRIEVRRCRPLLGTLVEISAAGLEESELNAAVGAAFAAIERVQKLMSVHAADSELSVVNGHAARRCVPVSPETFEVLGRADRLAAESHGAFDYAVAPLLARWDLLPASLERKTTGSWRDVRLLPGRRVRFLQPLALDLGGIAKGFAVDQATETLRKCRVRAARVNAGGDLRVFGAQPSLIHLRHPAMPGTFMERISVRDAALATSSPCFTEKVWRDPCRRRRVRVSHLVDPFRQTAVTGAVSVTVRAQECWLADALTKVVLNAPRLAPELLARHRAEAFVLTA